MKEGCFAKNNTAVLATPSPIPEFSLIVEYLINVPNTVHTLRIKELY